MMRSVDLEVVLSNMEEKIRQVEDDIKSDEHTLKVAIELMRTREQESQLLKQHASEVYRISSDKIIEMRNKSTACTINPMVEAVHEKIQAARASSVNDWTIVEAEQSHSLYGNKSKKEVDMEAAAIVRRYEMFQRLQRVVKRGLTNMGFAFMEMKMKIQKQKEKEKEKEKQKSGCGSGNGNGNDDTIIIIITPEQLLRETYRRRRGEK